MGTFITENILSEGGLTGSTGLNVTGTTSLFDNSGNTISFSSGFTGTFGNGGFTVNGVSTFNGIFNINGSQSITGGSSVIGSVTITNGLNVTGVTNVVGAFSATTLSGDGSGLTNITSSTNYGIIYVTSNSFLYI